MSSFTTLLEKDHDYDTPCFPHQKYLKKNNHLTSVIDKVTNVLLNLSVALLALNFVSRLESGSSTKFLKIASKEL